MSTNFDIKSFMANEGMTRVSRDRKKLLKENSEYGHVLDRFDSYSGRIQDGIVRVELQGKYNFFNLETGKVLSPHQWFGQVGDRFMEGFVPVCVGEADESGIVENGHWNWLSKDGNFLTDPQWFNYCDDFIYGFARFKLGDKWNYIDRDGKVLSKQWFASCWSFEKNGIAFVKLDSSERGRHALTKDAELIMGDRKVDLSTDLRY